MRSRQVQMTSRESQIAGAWRQRQAGSGRPVRACMDMPSTSAKVCLMRWTGHAYGKPKHGTQLGRVRRRGICYTSPGFHRSIIPSPLRRGRKADCAKQTQLPKAKNNANCFVGTRLRGEECVVHLRETNPITLVGRRCAGQGRGEAILASCCSSKGGAPSPRRASRRHYKRGPSCKTKPICRGQNWP